MSAAAHWRTQVKHVARSEKSQEPTYAGCTSEFHHLVGAVPLQHWKRLVDMSHTLMPREQSSLVLNQCISCGGRLNISMKISSGAATSLPNRRIAETAACSS